VSGLQEQRRFAEGLRSEGRWGELPLFCGEQRRSRGGRRGSAARERGAIYRRGIRVRVLNGPNWAGLGWPKHEIGLR
jgi:hypothetical protein